MRRRENERRGYLEVKTPLLYDKTLWITSGHWEKFRDNMFLIPGDDDDQTYGIKPMNCPGHMLMFGSQLRSYRDLPMRYAEAAPLHRNELTGTLHGLTRVRFVTQDDAHIFCTEEQVAPRSTRSSTTSRYLYGLFGMEPHAELSTRPDNKLGTDAQWDVAEGSLRQALERHGMQYVVGVGEGAFYGPKIDLFLRDVLGRAWQLGTIQYDMQMPERFGLTYMGADNTEHMPIVVHRALFGSFERFIGILIEHYAGAFPFWLSPVQVRVVPVGESHRPAADALRSRLPTPATASTSTSATRRWVGGSATPSWRRSRTCSSGATARPTTRSPSASAGTTSRLGRSASSSTSSRRRTPSAGEGCYHRGSAKQGRTRSSPPGACSAGVQPSRLSQSRRRGNGAAACSGFVVQA